jgi:hypothetical protein
VLEITTDWDFPNRQQSSALFTLNHNNLRFVWAHLLHPIVTHLPADSITFAIRILRQGSAEKDNIVEPSKIKRL